MTPIRGTSLPHILGFPEGGSGRDAVEQDLGGKSVSTSTTHDWSGIHDGGRRYDGGDDRARRLLVENTRLTGSLQRLGPAMASMAYDLARMRRENARLKRENQRLRTLAEAPGDPD